MNDLAELLSVAPRRVPFTSDDVCVFRRMPDPVAGFDRGLLLMIASAWRERNPSGSYSAFTRYFAGLR